MHSANGVLKAVVVCTGIHQVRQAQLRNAAQALEKWMVNEFENERVANGDEAVHRIIDDFSFCDQSVE